MYDIAIIGAGPAGLSAALNLQLHQKSVIWFGSKELSEKVGKSEKIANYPGVPMVTGEELNRRFSQQLDQIGLSITEKMVTTIMSTGGYYMLLADNELFEAKTVLFAVGAVAAKGLEGETELLGRGVSYCATCDGFLYSGKTIAVYCGSKRYEHEVAYLAGLAEKVYLYTPYPDCGVNAANVERLPKPIRTVLGEKKVARIRLSDGSELAAEGMFFLRSAVAPATLLAGLEMDGPHIAVNRMCQTNFPGCYAAGDCTGRPYQITKAVGEGNIAAHAILEYLAEHK